MTLQWKPKQNVSTIGSIVRFVHLMLNIKRIYHECSDLSLLLLADVQ